MKRVTYIFAVVAFLVVYHAAGVIWGKDAKPYFLVGMLVVYACLGLALVFMRRRLSREQPELAATFDSASSAPWQWRVLDAVLGITFAFIPPVVVSLARQQPLAWEGEFTSYHFLAMAGGVGVYILGRACLIRKLQRKHAGLNENAEQTDCTERRDRVSVDNITSLARRR